MAPSKKTLQGCSIALSGSWAGTTHGKLKDEIAQCGGGCETKVSDATTHLVVSEKDWNSKTAKVKQAENLDINIVSLDWLTVSFEAKKKVDHKPYLMANAASQVDGKTNQPEKGKKRGRSAKVKSESPLDEEEEEPPQKKFKDGQKARSDSVVVPIDEGCNLYLQQRVYVDEDDTIWDANLNQTNAGNNNNKFYRIQLIQSGDMESFMTWTRWGRVGEFGASKVLGDGSLKRAIAEFEKKFKDKTGHKWVDRLEDPKSGKYTFLERNYEPDSEDEDDDHGARRGSKTSDGNEKAVRKQAECTLEQPVQDLLRLIFNQAFFTATMADMSYDAQKLPLGKLSKRTLESGFKALKELAELQIDHSLASSKHGKTFAQAVEDLSNRYYTVIPHSFGRSRPPIIADDQRLKKEIELLDSLSEMSIADEIMKESKEEDGDIVHPLDHQFKGLNLSEMVPLGHESSEFKQLEDYLLKSHGSTHYMKFKVSAIFRIERTGERDRFATSTYGTLGPDATDRRLLWHGSRATNYGGILSQGLRIAPPEAPVSGYMFGKGVYLADVSSKSANYCCHHQSGGAALLLLCEAELGRPMYELTGASYTAGEEAREKGCWATWGKGMTAPQWWKDAGNVHEALKGVKMPDTTHPPSNSNVSGASLLYNEYICYDVAQICLRYLFRVEVT